VRRVTYFLGDGGLVKQEVNQPTADLVDDVPTAIGRSQQAPRRRGQGTDLPLFTMAPRFQDSWDGSTPGAGRRDAGRGPPAGHRKWTNRYSARPGQRQVEEVRPRDRPADRAGADADRPDDQTPPPTTQP